MVARSALIAHADRRAADDRADASNTAARIEKARRDLGVRRAFLRFGTLTSAIGHV